MYLKDEMISKNKLSILVIVCVILVYIFSLSTFSEEYPHPEHMSYNDTSNSFALTKEHMFFIEAWNEEEYAWFPDTIGLDILIISTGQVVRIAEFSSSWAKAFTDGEYFYFVESNYLNDEDEQPFTISIGKIDPKKLEAEWLDTLTFGVSKAQWIETLTFDTKGNYTDDWIRDVHIENGKLYFISYYKIYTYDLSTLELNVVYQSEKKIINGITENRSIVYKDKLYIHKEDGEIYEIDLATFTEHVVVYDAENLERDSDTDIYTAPYSYYIFDDTLYYCNEKGFSKGTYALNLVDGRKIEILEAPITFFLINEQGICFDIYDGGASRYFLNFYDNKITPIPINDFEIAEIMIEIMK